jgi:cyanophycinase
MRGIATLVCLSILSLSAASAQLPAPAKLPEPLPGALVIVGGGTIPASVVETFHQLAGGAKAKLVVIPTASASADKDETKATIVLWQKRGFPVVTVLHTRDRKTANDAKFAQPLAGATAVWFGGGDQAKIMDAYAGTAVEKELHALLKGGGVIGGTSAGAAVMSRLMIAGGDAKTPRLGEGFGFLPGAVVDQHFLKRNRADRLLEVLHANPGWFGVGIDEQTALVVHGRTIQVVGNSYVVVCQRSTEKSRASAQFLPAGAKGDWIEWSKSALGRTK